MVYYFNYHCLYSFAEKLSLFWEADSVLHLDPYSCHSYQVGLGSEVLWCSAVTGCEFLAAPFALKMKEFIINNIINKGLCLITYGQGLSHAQ